MINHLAIQNYALIHHLEIDFSDGLTTITGETGSGKSILLGALGLVLGKRADLNILKDKTIKCIIEATFAISNYKLKSFFKANGLDYEEETIIRREILPSGKSRAFINDTPVTVSVLSQLGDRLIDIHSQHQTLALSSRAFQFELLDAMAKNSNYIDSYSRGLLVLKVAQKELVALLEKQASAKASYDYNLHLFEELEQAKLTPEEQETLEKRLNFLEHIDAIKIDLSESVSIISAEQVGLQEQLFNLKAKFNHLASLSDKYEALHKRIDSLNIEFLDIASEVELALDAVDYEPSEIDTISNRLQLIYTLQKKHQVDTIAALLEKKEVLESEIIVVADASSILKEKEEAVAEIKTKLEDLSATIHDRRLAVIPKLQKQLTAILSQLGMVQARFNIELDYTNTFLTNGKDEIQFLFAANAGSEFALLKKVASGGELSRIMLAIKTTLSKHKKLPTIIFDEIDTGVSGAVANQIAEIMDTLASHMQVMAITHLPQIAAKGKVQLEVVKTIKANQTETHIQILDDKSRIDVIAAMISGENISEAARNHAATLLSKN